MPRTSGLMDEFLIASLSAADEAAQHLRKRCENVGAELGTALARLGVSPWMAAALVAAAAGELAHQWCRETGAEETRDAAAALPWFPALAGPAPLDEP